ncbi:hypothetical protein [Microcystis phage MinS1]|nr:hypothetical protein [Microcystis phage MinS1]
MTAQHLRACCDIQLNLQPIATLFDHPPVEWWRFVPCGTCNTRTSTPCQATDGPARRPHAARTRAARQLHATLWLLTHGFADDVLGSRA